KLMVNVCSSNTWKINSRKELANKEVNIDVGVTALPAGKYALQALDKMGKSAAYGQGYESAVKANFVSQETDVKSIVNKVQLGEVDAGFVYLTDVTSAVSAKVKM